MIDHASTGFHGNLSNRAEFKNALIADGQNILNCYNSMNLEQQAEFLNKIRQNYAHSFSDLIDATTDGQIHGHFVHSRKYWKRSGNLQAEAFAHFFEASMGGDKRKLDLLTNLFPNSFSIYSSMIKSIK